MELSMGLGTNHFYFSCITLALLVLKHNGSLAINFRLQRNGLKQQGDINDTGTVLRDDSSPATQERLHSAVIAAVIAVSLFAIVAGICIIRRYCFSRSNAMYRYSMMRGMEEENTYEDLNDGNTGQGQMMEETDDDLLE